MNSIDRKSGMGGGQGRRYGTGGGGRMDGTKAGGALGVCRCPNCGHSQPHERGMPCMQVKCPQCGASMIRE